jgi:hypothetical protein
MMHMANDSESRLDALFAAYREACPDPEPGADFMPGLWKRIEAARPPVFALAMWSRRVLMMAATLCLLLAAVWTLPLTNSGTFYQATYLETLNEEYENANLTSVHPAAYAEQRDAHATE